jgi:stearoyl-CoA desaturase (delta-9 desaturase)
MSTKTEKPNAKIGKPVWYAVTIIVTVIHIVSLLALMFYTPAKKTVWLVILTWIFGGLGITMGYHRLWSHRAFKAHPVVRFALAMTGVMAFQGSIKWWSLRHRLHHRYTDTEHDPYDATRGFWYSHMGWLFERPEYTRMKWIDKSDLDADPVVRFQHKNFPLLSILLGFVLPTILGFTWGDALGGFLYGGYVSRIVIWHSTWLINSLAHSWGEQEFSTENTSRGNLVLALLTFGEGHHNFHHEFPRDYRNGIRIDDYDPTKWVIAFLSYFGLTYGLIEVPEEVILKGIIR